MVVVLRLVFDTPHNMIHKKGFSLSGNVFFWLFAFLLIGLFLKYRGNTRPVVALWNDVKSIWTPKRGQNRMNPYRAPEPVEDVATDTPKRRDDVATDDGSLLDKEGIEITEAEKPSRESSKSDRNENVEGGSVGADFYLPLIKTDDQIVKHQLFTLKYVEQYEVAAWVAYFIRLDEISQRLERDNEFMPDPLVRTGSALSSDYSRSGFDRGHLCPAGDFNSSRSIKKETFYMSNISPQVPYFNRGIWNDLEVKFRDWVHRDGDIFMVTGPVLRDGLETMGRSNTIAVPEYFYKVAFCKPNGKPKMIAFLMKNEPSNKSLKSFVVTVDEVEKLTGIDFFPKLPDNLENRLEAQLGTNDWFSQFTRLNN